MKNFYTAFFAVFILALAGCSDSTGNSVDVVVQDAAVDVSDVAEAGDIAKVTEDVASSDTTVVEDAQVKVEDVAVATEDAISDAGVSVDGDDNNESDQGE